jgi:hypothetical protein
MADYWGLAGGTGVAAVFGAGAALAGARESRWGGFLRFWGDVDSETFRFC